MPAVPYHVVVIGGGITGLAAAYALHDFAARNQSVGVALSCTLVEASGRLGGKIITDHFDGFVIEGGPESFLAQKPWGIDLCRRLGLADSLIGTNPEHRKTFVWLRGRLHKLPEGLVMGIPAKLAPFLRTTLLSWPAKLRLGAEFFVPANPDAGDESLGAFFRRRLGQEALDHIVEPLLTGIYTGDADQLSVLATFPRFRQMEQEHGSLVKALWHAKRLARKTDSPGVIATPFVTLREGLGHLVHTLETSLKGVTVLTGMRVRELRRQEQRYVVKINDQSIAVDAVIVTTPAYDAAELLAPLDPLLGEHLAGIVYAGSVTVSLGFRKLDLRHDLDGYGFVVPRIEHRALTASTWTSSKWDSRAPQGSVLLRCYLGGIGREDVLGRTDQELIGLARDDLRVILGIDRAPILARVYRWPRAMPQYHVGHLDRLAAIADRLHRLPGVFLAGAGYRGVGIPDCIRDGIAAADDVCRSFDKALRTFV
jgi:oxygen-dependent protoporphyrinogen oxidase